MLYTSSTASCTAALLCLQPCLYRYFSVCFELPYKLHSITVHTLCFTCLSVVLRTLRQLSTTSSILSDPSLLHEEAIQAVTHTDVQPCSQRRWSVLKASTARQDEQLSFEMAECGHSAARCLQIRDFPGRTNEISNASCIWLTFIAYVQQSFSCSVVCWFLGMMHKSSLIFWFYIYDDRAQKVFILSYLNDCNNGSASAYCSW